MKSAVADYVDDWRRILGQTHTRRTRQAGVRPSQVWEQNEESVAKRRYYERRLEFRPPVDEETGEPLGGDRVGWAEERLQIESMLNGAIATLQLEAMDRAAAALRGTTRKVYDLWRVGHTDAEIAGSLGIKPPTVKYHVDKIQSALKPFSFQ